MKNVAVLFALSMLLGGCETTSYDRDIDGSYYRRSDSNYRYPHDYSRCRSGDRCDEIRDRDRSRNPGDYGR